ncbi:MAG TPA: acyclic terpene utilization AtuA family protein [Myxococcota bacterium]|nr:acyclic terpene utilization AtuA family protein [Myxococcota bacterium]
MSAARGPQKPRGERPLRIGNCSGFYGDRLAAAREMLEAGPLDVLTGDYLAELTMLILWKGRQRDPSAGYAATFLRQMEDVLGLALAKGVRIVVNAGGLNPAGLAAKLRELSGNLGLDARIAHVEGDDLLPRLGELQRKGHALVHLDTGRPLAAEGVQPVSANAYLGGWGIAACLEAGADIVVCPRVTDASLVVGPAVWHYGWARDDWDRIASMVVAGHVLECGPQATGGNYAFFREVPGLEHPGFPLAEIEPDGSFVVTKHPGTGGLVSVGTVTAQLLYEIAGPDYANPDAIARFDTIRLEQVGPDRVRVSGVRGEPAPPDLKVCINYAGGFRNSMTLLLTGLDVEEKAALVERTLRHRFAGPRAPRELHFHLARTDHPDPETNERATARFAITAKDPDERKVGRAFSSAVVELVLASYPGFYATSPPGDASAYGVYWPALVPAGEVPHAAVLPDGRRVAVPPAPAKPAPAPAPAAVALPAPPAGATRAAPLGALFGARSGDKGGNANLGVWARSDLAYAWLERFLTAERLQALLPEAAAHEVRRYAFPNLRALNFVVVGLLGEGVASSLRPDPQAKSLGEWLRARVVDVPEALLAEL